MDKQNQKKKKEKKNITRMQSSSKSTQKIKQIFIYTEKTNYQWKLTL